MVGKMLKFNWENNVFTALLQHEKKYYIMWGKSEEPQINIEDTLIITNNAVIKKGNIVSNLFNYKETLYNIMALKDISEYETAEGLIRYFLGG